MEPVQIYGRFVENGKAFEITQRNTPRNWYNYFYNDTYNAFASQVAFGEGIAQDDLGRRVNMVSSRMLYLTDADDKSWFCANGLPIEKEYQAYRCVHKLGCTTIYSRYHDIAAEYTLFVPREGCREVWTVKITNHRQAAAKLGAIAYCATGIDGEYRPQGYNTDVAGFDSASQAAVARGYAAFKSEKSRAVYQYMVTDSKVKGYDTARNAFIGVYGSVNAPQALIDLGKCKNSDCVGEKICLALETACELEAGESKTFSFIIGLADLPKDIIAEKNLLSGGWVEKELDAVCALRQNEIGGAVIKTPDEQLNNAFNGFYQYATAMGSRWARVRHNGYRDLMSDCECASAFNPHLAWERCKRALTYQYSNGYAPRTFIDGAIRDNNFSDCAVWITFAVYAIVMEQGDASLLQELVPFNDNSTATVYEHMKRSVDYLFKFTGPHGLIRIWGGDWNDCMNEAGLKGRGESVWLSIAWCRAAKLLAELAEHTGRKQEAQQFRKACSEMEQRIEAYGWDGEYYITALDDEGRKIGSHENKEGSLYLNPQLWAVLGEVGSAEHRKKAMNSVKALETLLGAAVSAPPYTQVDHTIGSMTTKAAGMHENGGVYLHSMCWKLAVDAMLNCPQKVAQDIAQILPWNQTFAPTVGEPYILFNSYFAEQTGYRYATPGQSWRTASTAWFVKAMLLYIFGLQPKWDGLWIRPCLPLEWTECNVTKKFRKCVYNIQYTQVNSGGRFLSVTANGQKVNGALPYKEGAEYQVKVVLGTL